MDHDRFGWVYFEVVRGCYGLPQAGKLAHDILSERLQEAGYYETATTPGLWRHRWRPIQFVLIVDDFGVEYVKKRMLTTLQKPSRSTTQSPRTGRERNFPALTWPGTTLQTMPTKLAACP